MTRVVLIHHHIFKNAGTSFNSALKGYFGNAFFEFDLPNDKAVTQQDLDQFIEAHPNALAISSHHACMPTPQGEHYQTISSVILRDPLDRIKSIYNFEKKQNAQTQGALKAKELTFKDYILWRLKTSPAAICNYQTHYCSRTKSCPPHYQSTENDLKLALENLQKATVVGLVERYRASLDVAHSQLSPFYPDITLKNVHLNQTSSSDTSLSASERQEALVQELGADLYSHLAQNNYLDQQLYEAAQERLEADLLRCKATSKKEG